jgi:predicted DNA-binding transcriptional regulator AlpA
MEKQISRGTAGIKPVSTGKALALIKNNPVAPQKWRKPYALQALILPSSQAVMATDSKPGREQGRMSHLTPLELADRFQVNDGTLANWRSTGEGPRFIKVGKLVRYPMAEVEAWEKNQLKSNTGQ